MVYRKLSSRYKVRKPSNSKSDFGLYIFININVFSFFAPKNNRFNFLMFIYGCLHIFLAFLCFSLVVFILTLYLLKIHYLCIKFSDFLPLIKFFLNELQIQLHKYTYLFLTLKVAPKLKNIVIHYLA